MIYLFFFNIINLKFKLNYINLFTHMRDMYVLAWYAMERITHLTPKLFWQIQFFLKQVFFWSVLSHSFLDLTLPSLEFSLYSASSVCTWRYLNIYCILPKWIWILPVGELKSVNYTKHRLIYFIEKDN